MSRSWRTVRVFISSTFRDMHAERDRLIKVVFPALREKLEPHRIHLVDIDLRWGVTAEQADNDRVLDLCLDEIKKSRPFFIGILGQRYGWVPKTLPEAALNKHGWLQGLVERSITELEILHGVLNDPKMRMHSMFYFRKADYLASVPQEIRDRVYLDEHADQLKTVKEAIRRHCQNYGAPLHEYPCAWDPSQPNPEDGSKGRLTGLDEFGEHVRQELLAAMSREFPELLHEAQAQARPGAEDWLSEEADYHERFIEARLQVYVGRDTIHRQLLDYLGGDSNRPLVLSGGSGTGKSSILGRLWDAWREEHPEDFLLPHFVGSSPSSTDIRMTLRRLCLALKERFKPTLVVKSGQGEQAVPREVPEESEKLPEAFKEFLQAVPEGRRAVLVIDAVNQFDVYGGAHDMTWLPDALPPGVKIIVSCIEEPEKEQVALAVLRARGTPELKVEPLSNEERFEIVAQVPSISAKSLDPKQVALLLDNPATTNPLYLTVALEELRGFGSFEKLNERIRSFPRTGGEKGLDELFLQVLARLESELGQGTVYLTLASIATSRHGLSEKELSEFLNRLRLGQAGPAERSGAMLLALRQLRAYLLRRGPYVDFYHRNLYKAVRRRYLLREDIRLGIHHALAEYFRQKGLKSERMLSETAHHLREAGKWDELDKLLTDLRFVEAKCAAGMTYELVEDYGSALEAFPEAQEGRRKGDEHRLRIDKYVNALIAYSKGETATLEIIPSVRPWTDEEFEADSARIIKNPSRLERVRAFSQFVNSESHALAKFGSIPGFCIQHAHNCVDSGPVGALAEKLVASEADKAMVLHAPCHRLKYNPHPALLQTLAGHTGYVNCVSITPDGNAAVSGSVDDTVRLWDLKTGRCLQTLEGHTSTVESVSVTPDGKRAVSGSDDKTLRVWNLETGRCLRTLEGHTREVQSISVTPDGKRAVSGGNDKTLRVWDLETGRCLWTLEGHTGWVRSVSVTPYGRRAVSGGDDKTLRVWNLESGRCSRTLEGHTWEVKSISVTPDGKRAVSGSDDKTLRVWDLETGRCLRTLEGHTHFVDSVSVTPDGKRAVSGSPDNTLRLWDLETGRCLRTLTGHARAVRSVSVMPDGKRAVSASWDQTLRLWDLEAGRSMGTLELHTSEVASVSVTPGIKRAVSGCDDRLHVWDLETGRCLRTLEGHTGSVWSVSVTPDGKRAVSGGDDKTLRVWDLETGRCLRILEGHTGWVRSVSVTPDGRRAISGGDDKTLRLWDLETGHCLRTLEGHTLRVICASGGPDGKRAISGSEDHTLRVWDLETGISLRTLTGHTEYVLTVSVTPDGKRAVSGSMDNTFAVWDMETGRCLRTLEGHTHNVSSASVMPDGKRAAWGSCDNSLRVWNLETGLCVAVYLARDRVNSISHIGADGTFAAAPGNAVVFLRLRNIHIDTPLVSPSRIWLYLGSASASQWEDAVKAACPWCGQRFPVPAGKLELIRAIAQKASLTPEQSPCLELPAQARDEPGLASECPLCRKPLRFNPFIVDERGSGDDDRIFVESLRDGLEALAAMEEAYKKRHGRYTDQLTDLASLTEDPLQFAKDVTNVFRFGSIIIQASAESYLITGQAQDANATESTIGGPPARFQ